MSFLNPLALFGLVAAAIPLLIHLFQFQRPRQVAFSSVSFVKALEQSTIRRMKVRRWLLLLLRTLAIVCLVLAFARPTLTGPVAGTFGGRASTATGLVVDNSLSMTLRGPDGVRLERAREAASRITEQSGEDDEIHLWTTAGRDSTAGTRFTSGSAARAAIQEIEPEVGAHSLARVARRAAEALAERPQLNREVFLIGDLQRSTLGDTLEAAVPEGVRLRLVPVGGEAPQNVGISSVRVVSRIVEVGQPVELEATVRDHGSTDREGLVASLYLEDERVAQSTATVEAGTGETVSFTVVPQRRGWLRGRVQLEEDAFPDDDRRTFVLHVPTRRSVLLVEGQEVSTRFVDLVLSTSLTEEGSPFAVERVAEDQLPSRDLARYDAVILAGVRDLSTGETEALGRYLEGGGGLLLFPGAEASATDYNRLLGGLGGGRFTGFIGSLGSRQPVASVADADFEHPVFRGMFAERSGRSTLQIERVPVYFAMNYRAGGGNEQTLVELSNGSAFLHEIRHGEGRMLLSAVYPSPAWSELPMRGLFVPLLHRSLYYLSAGSVDAQAAYEIGRVGELQVRAGSGETPVQIVGPGGAEYLPEQRTVLGTTRLRAGAFLDRPGVYELRRGDRLLRRVAVNAPAKESDLAVFEPGEAADRLSSDLGRSVELLQGDGPAQSASLGETVRQQRYGVELWNVFLILALAFLAAEMGVASYQPSAKVSA